MAKQVEIKTTNAAGELIKCLRGPYKIRNVFR